MQEHSDLNLPSAGMQNDIEVKPDDAGVNKALEATENALSQALAMKRGTAAKAFQRVKAEEWLDKKAARDNSYEATFGNAGWGAKAQEVLGQVNNQMNHQYSNH